jgi:hypothetical protein
MGKPASHTIIVSPWPIEAMAWFSSALRIVPRFIACSLNWLP